MARVFDTRNAGGQLVILGDVLVLPNSSSTQQTPVAGAMRLNSSSNAVEVYINGNWTTLGGGTQNSGMQSSNSGTGAFRNAWSSSTIYNYSDTVTYNGSTYFCLVSNSDETPGSGSSWVAFG